MIHSYILGDYHSVKIHPDDYFGMDEDTVLAGLAFTISCNEEIIAIVGANQLWPGVAHGWVLVDAKAKAYPHTMVTDTRKIIKKVFKQLQLVRMHTLMRPEKADYLRWAEMVGFRYESTMRKGGKDGKDILMYSIVKDGV
jgi:hypothetical protein